MGDLVSEHEQPQLKKIGAKIGAVMCSSTQNPTEPKRLEQVRTALRILHYSPSTEESYVNRIKRFILFHNKRHPREMGAPEAADFLTHPAVPQKAAASTWNQALCAIVLLYRHVLKQQLGRFGEEPAWAKKPERVPEVFTQEGTKAVLRHLSGTTWIMAMLL
jgi:predicted phosphoadenosine phosphosulfate sulfurtransferase